MHAHARACAHAHARAHTLDPVTKATAPKLRRFLTNPIKSKLFELELTVVVYYGKSLKARNTKLEGDTFEFITGYDTVMHMGAVLKSPLEVDLKKKLQTLAVANGAAPAQTFAAPTIATAAPAPTGTPLTILQSLAPSVFKTVNGSVSASYFSWSGDNPPPQQRYSCKPTSWACETPGNEEIRLKFEKGRDDNGVLQPGYESTTTCTFAKLMEHGFCLEPFDDGAAAPRLSAVIAPQAPTFLLSASDFSDIEVPHSRTPPRYTLCTQSNTSLARCRCSTRVQRQLSHRLPSTLRFRLRASAEGSLHA